MNAIPIESSADDCVLEVGDDGCVHLVCQMCFGDDEWDREAGDLRYAAVLWDAHVGQVHS